MLTNNDCLSILIELEDRGININTPMKKLIVSQTPPIDVLKFIVENKGIETVNFFEFLRKKHNQKKSPLYSNILSEVTDTNEILVTLSCLLTQIVLYNKKLDGGNDRFLNEARAKEITQVLNNYFTTYNIDECKKLLKIIKTDLLVLEYLNGRREIG